MVLTELPKTALKLLNNLNFFLSDQAYFIVLMLKLFVCKTFTTSPMMAVGTPFCIPFGNNTLRLMQFSFKPVFGSTNTLMEPSLKEEDRLSSCHISMLIRFWDCVGDSSAVISDFHQRGIHPIASSKRTFFNFTAGCFHVAFSFSFVK